MRDLTSKMKDGKIAIGDTSVEVMDSNGNFRDMTDVLKDVENATDGMEMHRNRRLSCQPLRLTPLRA